MSAELRREVSPDEAVAVYTLKTPIVLKGMDAITVLRFRAPTMADLKGLSIKDLGEAQCDACATLMGRLAGLGEVELGRMQPNDFFDACGVMLPLFQGPATSAPGDAG
jgi:hypothetical protein